MKQTKNNNLQKEIMNFLKIAIILFILVVCLKLFFLAKAIPQQDIDSRVMQDAIENNNLNLCDQIVVDSMKRDCFTSVLSDLVILENINEFTNINESICSQTNIIDLETCLYGLAVALEDEFICFKVQEVNNNLAMYHTCTTSVLVEEFGTK
jgi:hypothetical protein